MSRPHQFVILSSCEGSGRREETGGGEMLAKPPVSSRRLDPSQELRMTGGERAPYLSIGSRATLCPCEGSSPNGRRRYARQPGYFRSSIRSIAGHSRVASSSP